MEIRFERRMNLGTGTAESDGDFLSQCFLETPEFYTLRDFDDKKMILLGRTGTGKTALLKELSKGVGVSIEIKPDKFALQYVSNLPFIQELRSQGVNLDIYYKFLWLHEIMSRIIKEYFAYRKRDFIDTLTSHIKNFSRISQMKRYFEENGNVFFEEGSIERITNKIERDLGAELGIDTVRLLGKLSTSQKSEIQTRTATKVRDSQINQLKNIIELLREYLDKNRQKRILVIIDDLDMNWIDGNSKYYLLSALLDAVRMFVDIPNLKILLAMRADLLMKTCEVAKRQTEKDKAFTLDLNWTKDSLRQVLDKRINWLFCHKYSKHQEVSFSDIFGSCSVDGITASEYILDRSMMRPRDVIVFVNYCIREAESKLAIDSDAILSAEKIFRRDREQAICFEWKENFPEIQECLNALCVCPQEFDVNELVENFYDKIEGEIFQNAEHENEPLVRSFLETDSSNLKKKKENIENLISIFFLIGVVGKIENGSSFFSSPSIPTLTRRDYMGSSRFVVHPLFRM